MVGNPHTDLTHSRSPEGDPETAPVPASSGPVQWSAEDSLESSLTQLPTMREPFEKSKFPEKKI